jgi:WD40 repeat protein
MSFSVDGKRLATFGSFDRIRLWDTDSMLSVMELDNGCNVNAADFLPDNDRIAVAGVDGSLRLWSVSRREAVLHFEGHDRQIESLSISRDGSKLVTTANDDFVKIWKLPAG